MVSRVALAATLAVAALGVGSGGARTPVSGTAIFVVQHDARLCPTPLCGGYLVALANGARTRCVDGQRRARCYAAVAVDRNGRRLGRLGNGALARGVLTPGRDDLGALVVHATYVPEGSAPGGGGFYRVVDNGTRCVRAPCFSFTARSVNAATGVRASEIDLGAAGAGPVAVRRAGAALQTSDGLYARGRFAPAADGGRIFRALRLYLRAPLPRA